MARKPRIHFSGAHYHVMLRGNGGDKIFFDPSDQELFLKLLSENITRFNFRIHAFCLMTNHVHLALQVNETSISKIIQNISFRYTSIINKKTQRIGHLFQGRFKAILIDADNYLLRLIQYIHLNPVRANIVESPEHYLWSSHRAYLNLSKIEWLTTNDVLNYFSPESTKAREKYKLFMMDDNSSTKQINFETSNQKTFPAIGDDAFMKNIESIQNLRPTPSTLTLKEIIKKTCEFYQINEEKLHTKTRARKYAKIRAVIAWIAIEFKISTTTKVALHFGREHSTVSRLLKNIYSHLNNDLIEIKKSLQYTHTQA